jgi:glutathione synthase/RimK-type ligase-like ATP-grasp enzyme
MEAMFGVLINEFSGTWISNPLVTRSAENKIIQLKAAQQIGFKIPKTLVSQDPYEIRKFCKSLKNEVVIKPVKGTSLQAVFTRKITEEHLKSDYSLRLAPAMYQEFIPGNKHIRVHCFGNSVYAVLIESELLDWRENLEIPFKIIDLDENMKKLSLSIVDVLGLKMGIIDIKLIDYSTPIWLEINPQGQFLFVEGLSGLNLSSFFSQFLYAEAKNSRNSQESLSC